MESILHSYKINICNYCQITKQMSEIFVSVLHKQRKSQKLQDTNLFKNKMYGTRVFIPY